MSTDAIVDTDRDEQARLLRLELIQRRRAQIATLRRDPLVAFTPHSGEGRPRPDGSLPGGQHAFFQAANHQIRGVVTGNRWGKSMVGCTEDCAWAKGQRIWYPLDSPLRRLGIPPHPVKLLILTTDWDVVQEVWTKDSGDKPGKLWKYLANEVKSKRRTSTGVICYLEHTSGSEIFFDTERSFMNDRQSAESKDWDAIHVDEPICEDMYKAHARGLMDRRGKTWFTLTAMREPWIIDLCKQPGNWYYEGSTYENPHLTREAIAEFESLLTPDERECRIEGKPLHLAGLVYKTFSRDRHLLTEPPLGWAALDQPPSDHILHIFIDPHPQTPTAVLFCAVGPDGIRHYYKDIFTRMVVSEVAERIKELSGGYRVAKVRIDPAAFIRDPKGGRSVAKEYAHCGLPVTRAIRDLEGGIIKVNQELKADPTKVRIHATAPRTLWEIERYCWDPRGSNKPMDENDHMVECLYRCEYENPKWYPASLGPAVNDIEISSASLDLPSYETSDFDSRLSAEAEAVTLD